MQKNLPGAGEGQRGKSEIRRRAASRRTMKKSRSVWVIERQQIRRNDPVQNFTTARVGSSIQVPKRMVTIKITKNEKISVRRKNGRSERDH